MRLGFAVAPVLTAALLAGCGQVVVFGHVVGEKPPAEESQPAAQPATGTSTAGAPADGDRAASAATAGEPAARVAATQPNAATPSVAQAATALQVKAFQISVAPKATENVASDATFSTDALVNALRNELRSRNLLAEQRSPPDGTLQIQVSEVVLRPSSNAIVFGYKMMASTLIADVRLSGPDDKAAAPFHIAAQARLTLSTRSQESDRDQPKGKDPLGPLYRRFAVLTADRLTGIESKPDPETSGDIPRF